MIAVVLGRLAQFVVMFLSVKLMTTFLPPAEMGKIALVNSGTAFFALLLVNPVGMFINRRLHAWIENGRMRSYFHWFSAYLMVVAIAGASIMWVLDESGIARTGVSGRWLVLLVGMSLLFNSVHQTLIPSLNLIGRLRPFLVMTVASLVTGLLFSLVLVHLNSPSAELWLAGGLLAQCLFGIVAYSLFFRDQRIAVVGIVPSSEQVRTLLTFSVPVAFAVAFNWAHMQGYRFILADFGGLKELGIFAAGYGVAVALMAALELILTTILAPRFYRQLHSSSESERAGSWRNYADIIFPASLLGASAVMAAAPDLAIVFLGPSYRDAGHYIWVGALAELARIVVGACGLQAHAGMNTRTLLLPSMLGAVVALGLIHLLVPGYGIDAAPVAVALGGLVAALMLGASARSGAVPMRMSWPPVMVALGISCMLLMVVEWIRALLPATPSLMKALLDTTVIFGTWLVSAAMLWRFFKRRPGVASSVS